MRRLRAAGVTILVSIAAACGTVSPTAPRLPSRLRADEGPFTTGSGNRTENGTVATPTCVATATVAC